MAQKHGYHLILAAAGVLAGLTLAALVRDWFTSPNDPPPVVVVSPPGGAPIDEQAVRSQAWECVAPLLVQAEQDGAAALERHLATVPAFMAERKKGSRAFAERLLGLRGKWELVKSKAQSDGDDEYARWLNEQFAAHVFRGEELQQTVEAAVRAYLSELEGIENQLLIRLRADLTEGDLPAATVIPALRSEALLRQHYDAMLVQVVPLLDTDLAVLSGREVGAFVIGDLTTLITLRVGSAVAARLGVSAGILSAGAASSWTTLGVGIVVGLVLDQVIGQLIKAAGYDAEERVAARIDESLDAVARTITDGDPEARAILDKLKELQRTDPDEEVRAACVKAVRDIESGSRLYGLRGELSKVNRVRAALRKEALSRLVRGPEVNP